MSTKSGNSSSATDKKLENIDASLNQIATCLGFIVVDMGLFDKMTKKKETTPEKMKYLNEVFGFDNKQIAAILSTTPDTVSSRRSEKKKKKKVKK